MYKKLSVVLCVISILSSLTAIIYILCRHQSSFSLHLHSHRKRRDGNSFADIRLLYRFGTGTKCQPKQAGALKHSCCE